MGGNPSNNSDDSRQIPGTCVPTVDSMAELTAETEEFDFDGIMQDKLRSSKQESIDGHSCKMTQPSTTAGTTSVPPELRVDLAELAEDLLSYQFEDFESLGPDTGSGSVDQPDLSSGRQALATDLSRRINRARSQIQRALEAARKLTSCDLDVDAQEKLLLAMCTSCITKRQLVCLLKRELSRFSKDTGANYFESP